MLLVAFQISLEQTIIPVLVAVISSGFLIGLFKVMPERKSILVQASENAVMVVNQAIAHLHKELAEARQEISHLEAELKDGRIERTKLLSELDAVRMKVAKLEAELAIYTRLAGRGFARSDEQPTKIDADVHIKSDENKDEPQGGDEPAHNS
jgi:septal ring factor EnvC (AmiA/AmiB activator)